MFQDEIFGFYLFCVQFGGFDWKKEVYIQVIYYYSDFHWNLTSEFLETNLVLRIIYVGVHINGEIAAAAVAASLDKNGIESLLIWLELRMARSVHNINQKFIWFYSFLARLRLLVIQYTTVFPTPNHQCAFGLLGE